MTIPTAESRSAPRGAADVTDGGCAASNKPRSLRFQWGLRTLLAALTLSACGLAGWRAWIAPLRAEIRAIARLESLGAKVETVPAGAEWLRRLPGQGSYRHATRLSLPRAKSPLSDVDFGSLSGLRRLQELGVAGTVTPRELRQLGQLAESLPELNAVWLGPAEISDSDLPLLRQIRQLKSVSLGGNVTIRGVEELADARPDVACGAPAESLYKFTIEHWRSFSPSSVVECFQAAARWKEACAQFKSNPQARQAAGEQLAENYQRLAVELPATSRHRAAVSLALANLNADLAEGRGDQAMVVAQRVEAAVFASHARELAWPVYEDDVRVLTDLIWTLAQWTRAHATFAQLRGDAAAELHALQTHVDDLDRIVHRVGPLFWHLARGGERDGLELAKVAHALAQAELSRHLGNVERQHASLRFAAAHAKLLLPALDRAHRARTINALDYLRGTEAAIAAQVALAEAVTDPVAARIARNDCDQLIDQRWQRIFLADMRSAARPEFASFLVCEQARRRLDKEGVAFFEGRF